jgi:hypothetical protein
MGVFWVSFAVAVVIVALFTWYMIAASRRERGLVADEHRERGARRRNPFRPTRGNRAA